MVEEGGHGGLGGLGDGPLRVEEELRGLFVWGVGGFWD